MNESKGRKKGGTEGGEKEGWKERRKEWKPKMIRANSLHIYPGCEAGRSRYSLKNLCHIKGNIGWSIAVAID